MISADQVIAFENIKKAALDKSPVSGLTHRHYKYPARFSPSFVSAVVKEFSLPGDVVLDPYMGGGTTIVEATASGRQAIGCDLNSLAVFVSRAKVSTLTELEERWASDWATNVVPKLSYFDSDPRITSILCETRTRNLHLPTARAIKKYIALALLSIEELPSQATRDIARCALLSCSQWALNGRKKSVDLAAFRTRLTRTAIQAIEDSSALRACMLSASNHKPVLIHDSAENIAKHSPFADGVLADLVVTSPPYPGIHVLYHRWQVDGRRESPAPYWIADCLDGQGSSYYTFGGRSNERCTEYFNHSLRTLKAIRSAMKDGAVIAQMIAFSKPASHLRRYLRNMEQAGFSELRNQKGKPLRTWRDVPGRSWHASLKGKTAGAREVVLLHRAS